MTDSPGITSPANAPRPRLLVRLLVPLLVLAVSGTLALVVAEVAVRIAAPQQLIVLRPDLWQPADTVGWHLRPDISTTVNTGERTVRVLTNREGFRVGITGRKEAAVRVLLIGDSFAEAIQVEHEQTFAHLLEQALTRALDRDVAVRNAGVSDWGPNNYLLRTRQLLARDTFDLLVVSIFVGNDAVTQRRESIPRREPVERHRLRLPRSFAWSEFVQAFLAPVNDALEGRSHLFVLLKNQFSGLRMRLGVSADYLPLEFRRTEAASPRWAVTAEISHDIEREARAHGIAALFILIPERVQVYEDDFRRYVEGFGIDTALVDLDQPSRMLHEAFTAQGLRVIDALAAFREASKRGPKLFGTVDQHLSSEGHRVLTNLLAPAAAPLVRR